MMTTYNGMKGMMTMATGTKIELTPLERAITPLLKTPLPTMFEWEKFAIGDSGDIGLEQAWLSAAQDVYNHSMPKAIWELYRVFCAKQHDYGPQNIALGGTKGVTQRMVDKMARLWNLLGLGNSVAKAPANKEEAIYDTLMDLADYAIIAMLTENGSWPLITIEDAFDTGLVKSDTQQPTLPMKELND